MGDVGDVLIKGCTKLGIRVCAGGPVAITSGSHADRPHCIYRGFCIQGCKVGAKQSTLVSHVPDAIHHGAGSDAGPVFIMELEEIAELMASNSKVTSVNVVDVKTGQTWHMTRQDVFELRLTRRSVLINPVVSDRFGHQRSFKPSQLMECWIVSGLWRK